MKSYLNTFILLVICTLPAALTAQPAGNPVTIGQELTINSKVLDEERSIIVGLPASYGQESGKRYPVLYVLDGDRHFHYTTALTTFLSGNEYIPEMIVVAVNNTDRPRDMTPPSQEPADQRMAPTQGGAENFQRFFAEDLKPWVESNYRTHPYSVLVGHSFGGLFGLHTIITQPDLFDAYIAISPSMQWNAQRLVDEAEVYFDQTDTLPVSLYMTAGNEGGELLGGTRKLAGVLDARAPSDFFWHFEHMPLENHGTVPHRSTYQGLEFIFANWVLRNPGEVYKQYGMAAIEQFHASGDQRYRTDRGIPDSTLRPLLRTMVAEGELASAVALISQPASMKNASSRSLSYLAGQLQNNGDEAQARELYRQALAKNPNDRAAQRALNNE